MEKLVITTLPLDGNMGREQWLTASGRNPPSADDEHAAEAGLHQTARDKRADGGSILIWNKDGGVLEMDRQ